MEKQLLARIRAVNIGRLKWAELIFIEPHKDGRIAAGIRFEGKSGKGDVRQICIQKPMVRSLIRGGRNANLDGILRL